jgi:RimJ/RimL family protein N-acetyltransferase
MNTAYGPLDPTAGQVLGDVLGDTPETVISAHLLRRGLCRAYVAGDLTHFEGAIVQATAHPTEPTGFGSNADVLWELLQAVEGWDCINVSTACARPLGEILSRGTGAGVRYLDDVYHTLTEAAAPFTNEAVRLLTEADLDLLASAAPELRASCWETIQGLLEEGIVACAIVGGHIAATALTAARTERYAEVGVYTKEAYRRRGFATAAASLVTRRVQEAGQIPVWSAGGHNVASLRVAEKLGFVEVSRRVYVIPERATS